MNSAEKPIRILIVDDHPLLREGIAALVAAEPDMQLVAEAATGGKLSDNSNEASGRHLDGPTDARYERDRSDHRHSWGFPNARIIVLTTYTGDVQVLRALKAGARAYLLKGRVNMEPWRSFVPCIAGKNGSRRRLPPNWPTTPPMSN